MGVQAAIVLSAGASARMGRPKALLTLDDRPLVCAHIEALRRAAHTIAVVTGRHAEEIRAILPNDVAIVHNERWQQTHPIDSLALALAALSIDGPLLVSPVDVLPAREETLRRLLHVPPPAVPVTIDGARGHPVLLGPNEVAKIRAGEFEVARGLRGLLDDARLVAVDDPQLAVDFDDETSWQRARERYLTRRP